MRRGNVVVGHLPLGNPNLLSLLEEKGRRLCRQQIVLLMSEDFGLRTCIVQLSISANILRLNSYMKHNTKCETVAEIEDTQVAKLWCNDHVQYHRNWPIP
jgi:hypothetical protein